MTDKPDNPFAYPLAVPGDVLIEPTNGMTLRDYFAAKALAQVVRDVFADPTLSQTRPAEMPAIIAKASYQIADALLTERLK